MHAVKNILRVEQAQTSKIYRSAHDWENSEKGVMHTKYGRHISQLTFFIMYIILNKVEAIVGKLLIADYEIIINK